MICVDLSCKDGKFNDMVLLLTLIHLVQNINLVDYKRVYELLVMSFGSKRLPNEQVQQQAYGPSLVIGQYTTLGQSMST